MNFIAFDLETTGLKPPAARIVEIGAVRFCAGEVDAVFGALVDPGVAIPYEAVAVHGITDAMVQGCPRIEAVLSDFSAFCGDLPLVAHNAPFDCRFLISDVKQHQAPAPKGVVLDSLTLARQIVPGLASYKLGSLARRFGFDGGTLHRAVEDSTYCGQLLLELMATLKARGEPCALEDLVRMSGERIMRFPQYAPRPIQPDLFS